MKRVDGLQAPSMAQRFRRGLAERGRGRPGGAADDRGGGEASSGIGADGAMATAGRPLRSCDQGRSSSDVGYPRCRRVAESAAREAEGGVMGVQRYTLTSGAVR